MLVILKKKKLLMGLVAIMAMGFLAMTYVGRTTETNLHQQLLELELEQQTMAPKEVVEEDCCPEEEFGDQASQSVANPMEIENQLEVSISSNYFVEYKMERDRIRSRQIDILREIVNNPNSVSENRMEAQQRLFTVSDNMEKELELESLLAAKGFDHTAVLIQPGGVTIVVGKGDISAEEIARIADFGTKTTGYSIEDIVIVPMEQSGE